MATESPSNMGVDNIKVALEGHPLYYGNKFIIEFPFDLNSNQTAAAAFQCLCYQVNIPGLVIDTFQVKDDYFPQYPTAKGFKYEDKITVGIYETESFAGRQFVEQWMKLVVGKRNGILNYPKTYKKDFKIICLRQNGDVFFTITLFGAFPTSFQTAQLSFENSGSAQLFSIDFAFAKYEVTYPFLPPPPVAPGAPSVTISNDPNATLASTLSNMEKNTENTQPLKTEWSEYGVPIEIP